MSRPKRDPGPVPDRWLYCPRKSDHLIVGKFMAFKTPLDHRFDSQVPPECRFHPKMLFKICKAKKIKFGLWIDLTNTKRFYDQKEVEEEGCKYLKLSCQGHGQTPNIDQTNLFIQVVHKFIVENPLQSIAVHCTHGFNRTGFLIVSYLVKEMDFGLDVALQEFQNARPVGIYKEDYLQELYKRYDEIEYCPPPPILPAWCTESDDSNGNADNDDYNEAPSTSSSSADENDQKQPQSKNRRRGKEPEFMKGVPGVHVFEEQPKAYNLQLKVQRMCGWKNNKGFPGAQPISMDMKNLQLLHEKPYRVSWKADGMRYMMLIEGDNEVYFFDRDHNVFKVDSVRFVHRKDPNRHIRSTLIDGEMVIDVVNSENIPRYLIYDIVQFEGQEVGKRSFPTRLQCIDVEIIKPRHVAIENGLIDKSREPFGVRKKDFWPITQAASLLGEKFAKSLCHEPDGLIFQPKNEPYTAGRCDDVLKWKPLDLNSVDFRLKIVKTGGIGLLPKKECFLFVGGLDSPFINMKYTSELKDLDNKIIECKYENREWKFMRERTDKSFPNALKTAQAVCASIERPVTKEILLDFIERYRYNEDSDMMPPPNKRPRQ